MTRFVAVVLGTLTLTLLAQADVFGGAKEGKMRWSAKKTGACKWGPPLVIPKAQNNQQGAMVLKITYKANQLAEFFVIGDGDTDLDVVVKDAAGIEVAKDVDPPANMGGGSDMCVCRWKPAVEQEYTIIIFNNGPEINVAMAGTN